MDRHTDRQTERQQTAKGSKLQIDTTKSPFYSDQLVLVLSVVVVVAVLIDH